MMTRAQYNKFSEIILDSSIAVHKEMGPGLLESVYELCLRKELQLRGIKSEHQRILPLFYKGHEISKDLELICWLKKRLS